MTAGVEQRTAGAWEASAGATRNRRDPRVVVRNMSGGPEWGSWGGASFDAGSGLGLPIGSHQDLRERA